MKQYYYKLQWTDGQGGVYCRTFDTYEDREAFKPRVERRDWRGMSNLTTWEVSNADIIR